MTTGTGNAATQILLTKVNQVFASSILKNYIIWCMLCFRFGWDSVQHYRMITDLTE